MFSASTSSSNYKRHAENNDDDHPSKRLKPSSNEDSLLKLFIKNDWQKEEIKSTLPFILACTNNINYTNDDDQTILHYYLANNDSSYNHHKCRKLKIIRTIESLINRGASVNAKDKNGKCPLHIAAEHKKFELIKPMLQLFSHIDASDNEGNTVLHKILYRNFSDDDVYSYYMNTTYEAILYLGQDFLSRGADSNKKNNKSITPLHYSVSHCKIDLLKIFEDYGGDFSVITDDGENLLTYIAAFTRIKNFGGVREPKLIEVIEFLVKKGCDVNLKNNLGYSIIHHAAERHSASKFVEKLIEFGADVNSQTNNGLTPLHLAVSAASNQYRFEYESAMPVLARAGADWDAIDFENRQKPLDYALKANNCSLVTFILSSYNVDIGDSITANLVYKCTREIQDIMRLRAVEVKTLGFPIDEAYEPIIDEMKHIAHDHERRCLMEIKKLKMEKICDIMSIEQEISKRPVRGKGKLKAKPKEKKKMKKKYFNRHSEVTIYEFLHMNGRRQRAVTKFISPEKQATFTIDNFPFYGMTIQNCIEAVIRKKRLIKPAKNALHIVTKIRLPDLCAECIFDHLNNWTLKVLIDAGKIDD